MKTYQMSLSVVTGFTPVPELPNTTTSSSLYIGTEDPSFVSNVQVGDVWLNLVMMLAFVRTVSGAWDDIEDISNWMRVKYEPTTLAGYKITDALPSTGGEITGPVSSTATPTDNQHLVNKQYVDNVIPNVSGNDGKFLSTTGSGLVWNSVSGSGGSSNAFPTTTSVTGFSYVSGKCYYLGATFDAKTFEPAQGTIHFAPFVPLAPVTFSEFGMTMLSGTGTTFVLGVYDAFAGLPKTKVASNTASLNTGNILSVFNVSLMPNKLYFIAYLCTDGAPSLRNTSNDACHMWVPHDTIIKTVASNYTSMPDTLATSDISLTSGEPRYPNLSMRVA